MRVLIIPITLISILSACGGGDSEPSYEEACDARAVKTLRISDHLVVGDIREALADPDCAPNDGTDDGGAMP